MTLFDLSTFVGGMATDSIIFNTQTKTLNADGTYSNSGAAGSAVQCSVQPIQGKDAQATLELIRSAAGVSVFTAEDLTVGESGGESGDQFTWGGDTYEIRHKKNWLSGGAYYEYLAGKVN